MALDLFTPKAPPLFGLDISSSSVKMLEIVDAGKGGFRVERYAIEPLARDAVVDGNINNLEALIDAVKRGYKRLGTRTKHVVSLGLRHQRQLIDSADRVCRDAFEDDAVVFKEARDRRGVVEVGVVRAHCGKTACVLNQVQFDVEPGRLSLLRFGDERHARQPERFERCVLKRERHLEEWVAAGVAFGMQRLDQPIERYFLMGEPIEGRALHAIEKLDERRQQVDKRVAGDLWIL